jgi:WD40 repeat protein
MRQWFERQLITPAGTRSIVFRDTTHTADLPNQVVDFLEDRHLIRGEWRAGSRWYELTHDRFIEPIQGANEAWRTQRQARRNRQIVGAGCALVFGGVVTAFLTFLSFSPQAVPPSVQSTVVAANAVQTSISVSGATLTAVVVEEESVISKSRELAELAAAQEDPDLALLLAIEANQRADTQEARRSLHSIISSRGRVDGQFLRELTSKILSPTLIERSDIHNNWVLSVAFSPDGKRFVSASGASGDGPPTLILWDVATGEPIGEPLEGHRSNILSVAFSPDGKLIASASLDGQILLWDASTGEHFGNALLGHSGLVTCVAFSPDGTRLASGSDDNTVRIWDLTTRQSAAVLTHPDDVWSLAWSPDSKYVASASADSIVRLWNTETSEPGTEFRALKGHRGLVRSIAWSPDGQSLASASIIGEQTQTKTATGGEVILWDVLTGEVIDRPKIENDQPVRTVAFFPGGRILAFGQNNGNIILWDTQSRQALGKPLVAHRHWIMSIAFSPDGLYMVSGSIDKTVALWSLVAPIQSLDFSPADNVLAAGEGANISFWGLNDASNPLFTLSGHTDDVLELQFSPDGSSLVSGGLDHSARVWDVNSQKEVAQFLHEDIVSSVAFSPDGKHVASGSFDNTARVWEAATGREVARMEHEDAVTSVAFSPDGMDVLSVSLDHSARLWDAASGDEIASLQLMDGVLSAAFSPDGRYVVLGNLDGTALIWDTTTLETTTTMVHDDAVTSVAFSRDGKYVFSVSLDNIARVWDASTGKEITSLSIPGTEMTRLSSSIDGRVLAVGSNDGSIFLWDLGLLNPEVEADPYIGQACSLAGRNFTSSEWQQYFPKDTYRITCPNLPLP